MKKSLKNNPSLKWDTEDIEFYSELGKICNQNIVKKIDKAEIEDLVQKVKNMEYFHQ